MTLQALQSGRVTKNKQDGNREFISLLACVSAIGKAIPPLLIYKGASGDLQSSWVEDVTEDSETYFAATENGWSSNKIGLSWLKNVFERHTKPASPRARRLLLVDGHSSHVNIAFIDFADKHRIIVMILPPHTTHRLQPLDVGLFQPLSTAYSKELDDLMSKSGGLVSMSKQMFFPMFKRAWDKSFTIANIQHTFQKPGIWPTDGEEMIRRVTRPPPLLEEHSDNIKTPFSAKAIRHFRIAFEDSPTQRRVNKVFKATETMATKISILEHENRGLREAIILEKKKRKKGKRLNLCGEISEGVEGYAPVTVGRALAYHETKEAVEALELQAKEERKIKRAANALKNKQLKEEKEAKQAAAQLAKELQGANPTSPKTPSKQTKPVAVKSKKASVATPKAKKAPALSKKPAKLRKEVPDIVVVEDEGWEEVVTQNRRGRQIKLPVRFK